MADPCDYVEEISNASSATSHKVASFDSSSATAADASAYAIVALLTASAMISDATHDAFASVVFDGIVAADAVETSGSFHGEAVDSASMREAISQLMRDIAIEASSATDGDVARIQAVGSTAAALWDSFSQIATARNTVADAALAADVVAAIRAAYVADSATADDEVSHGSRVYAEVYDGASGATTFLQVARTSQVTVELASGLVAVADRNAAVSVVIEDGFGSSVIYEPAADGAAWTTLAQTWGMSRYAAMPFNSVAVVDGVTILAGESGLFALTGDTDNGSRISAYLDTGIAAFNDKLKRPRYAYVGYTSDGSMALDMIGAPAGSAVTYSHSFDARDADWMTPNRVKLARGLRSGYYKLRLKNQLGCDFLVNDLRIMFDEASRSV